MITKLAIFDFDGTISNSPKPEEGIGRWEKLKGVKFTHDDWWGSSESLDTNVFDFIFYRNVVNILNKEKSNPNTLVIILSSRVEKLRPYIKKILKQNSLSVKSLELKSDERTKGDKILELIDKFPALKQIDVYDDRDKEIKSYLSIKDKIPENIKFNIYVVNNGNINLFNSDINEDESIYDKTNMNKSGVPKYLPQLSAPFTEVLDNLAQDGIGYEQTEIDPNELNPQQPFTYSDRVEGVNLEKPIWISKNNDICDGHHRYAKAMFTGVPTIKAVRINLGTNDTCRALNKIQDIFEYSKQLKFEEDLNDTINNYNDKDNELSDYVVGLDEENEADEPNQVNIVGYRKEEIREDSPVGNFFLLEPTKGYKKYQIEFENLLDTDSLGLSYKDGQVPVDILAKTWFPHINFEKIAEKKGVDSIKIKNRAVAEKARKIGYDGIKYGKKLLQGL